MENTTTFRAVMVAGSHVSVLSARNLTDTERGQYAAWFAKIALIGIADSGSDLAINHSDVVDILGRNGSHQFPGCDNRAWIVTDAEEIALRDASARKAAAVAAIVASRKDEVETSPVCPHCGTHCYGDCEAN